MEISDLFNSGRLADSIAEATRMIKASPGDFGIRLLFAELLCFEGNFERADKQLEALESMESEGSDAMRALGEAGSDPNALAQAMDPNLQTSMRRYQVVREFRQLIRAAQWREQFFADGRVPEFVEVPCDELKGRVEATVAIREDDSDRAVSLLKASDNLLSPVAGSHDDAPFSEFRDACDTTASCFELLTTNGKYFWVPFNKLEFIEFRPHQSPRDVLWRSASFGISDGQTGDGYVPALYAGSAQSDDEQVRTGRVVEWKELGDGYSRGLGARLIQIDDDFVPLIQLGRIDFSKSSGGDQPQVESDA